jgi:hypothetical protein
MTRVAKSFTFEAIDFRRPLNDAFLLLTDVLRLSGRNTNIPHRTLVVARYNLRSQSFTILHTVCFFIERGQ